VQLSRRGFLKVSGATFAAGAMAELFGPTEFALGEEMPQLRIMDAVETPSICCYCSVGCGGICSVIDGELVNLEGDPDHPVNRGTLCSKGAAQFNVRNVYDPETGELMLNPYRETTVKYRAAGATEWEEVDWDWTITEIAKRVKETRDSSFVATSDGVTVNRTPGIGFIGGAALDDEECYVIQKLARALGVIDIEHQARI
jgi:formate dehydrogenase major subunit